MIVLLAAGIGVSVLGLLAIGFGIPISDTSFGNALLIAGVVIFCTGLILVGMWLAARELMNAMRLGTSQGVRVGAAPRPPVLPANPFAATVGAPAAERPVADDMGPASPPPWADEVATRNKPRTTAPEIAPVEPEPPPPPAPPDRPARRNLLFATKRRDREDPLVAVPTALEADTKVSFENAWPNPSRQNGAAERQEPVMAAPAGAEANGAHEEAPAQTEAAKPAVETPPGVTVLRSGNVDGMAYTLYSDGSIEAQFAGESPIRFASFAALKAHVEQQQQRE